MKVNFQIKSEFSTNKSEITKNYGSNEISTKQCNDNNEDQLGISASNEYLSFDEFCLIFQKICENSQNPKQVFLEAFAFLDRNK